MLDAPICPKVNRFMASMHILVSGYVLEGIMDLYPCIR